MTDLAKASEGLECLTCGHEFVPEGDGDPQRKVLDANGNLLADGDTVALIKDLKVKGSSATLKAGTKVKKIRLVDPSQNADHDIDAKVDGMAVLLRGKVVKKA